MKRTARRLLAPIASALALVAIFTLFYPPARKAVAQTFLLNVNDIYAVPVANGGTGQIAVHAQMNNTTGVYVGTAQAPTVGISGLNGSALTHQEYCELDTYSIASGTAAAHDAGFGIGTFPTGVDTTNCSIYSGDGGALVLAAVGGVNTATTGFTITTSANVTEVLDCLVCGH